MEDKLKKQIEELQDKITEMEKILFRKVKEDNMGSRQYTQNKVFTERVTFRNPKINYAKLPTNSTGLSVGDIYINTLDDSIKIKQ